MVDPITDSSLTRPVPGLPPTDRFDFIVVGAGTAGCVLAARLSQSGAHRVLLLEAGGEARSPWITMPAGVGRLLSDSRFNWLYQTEPEAGLDGRRLDVPCGRVIGGSGSINAMLYIRGHRQDYDDWAAAGNPGWSYADVLPWFCRGETNARGGGRFHGADGPMWVADAPHRHRLADAFVAAAIEAGYPANEDFNGPAQEGFGYYQANIRRGRRESTASAYLAPARERANLVVATRSIAERLLFDGHRARQVLWRDQQGTRVAEALRAIVVAAGTFNSPLLLLRSGIGSPAALARHGIVPLADLPGVGANLQNHFRASIVMRCRQPVTLNDRMARPGGRLRMGLEYLLGRSGPLAAPTYAGGFFRASPAETRPDAQVTFWTYSVARRDARGLALHPFSAFTAHAVVLNPGSRGSVELSGREPAALPHIRFNHLTTDADRNTIAAALAATRRILRMPALASFAGDELTPGTGCADAGALVGHARASGSSVFHPVGTCRMGTDALAVVDNELRVHGIDGLRIADASVMPVIPRGNTNAPTQMIAERAADWLLRDRG